jgi:hypothetical protein
MMSEPIHLISLGAGVQSSTMALMAACGEIEPMPKAAIFADTQDEPASVYRWLDWLEKQLPFPVERVTAGKLSESALALRTAGDGRQWTKTAIPNFTLATDGSVGRVPHRTCTRDYKIRPIVKAMRSLAKIPRGEKALRIIQWIGISRDEILRAKPGRDPWFRNRWPLIELRMTRHACLNWMETKAFPRPPRSACVYCPLHSDSEWRSLKRDEPEEFKRAVEFQNSLQASKHQATGGASVPFLHKSCQPLEAIDFDESDDQGLLWQDECEGHCGV